MSLPKEAIVKFIRSRCCEGDYSVTGSRRNLIEQMTVVDIKNLCRYHGISGYSDSQPYKPTTSPSPAPAPVPYFELQALRMQKEQAESQLARQSELMRARETELRRVAEIQKQEAADKARKEVESQLARQKEVMRAREAELEIQKQEAADKARKEAKELMRAREAELEKQKQEAANKARKEAQQHHEAVRKFQEDMHRHATEQRLKETRVAQRAQMAAEQAKAQELARLAADADQAKIKAMQEEQEKLKAIQEAEEMKLKLMQLEIAQRQQAERMRAEEAERQRLWELKMNDIALRASQERQQLRDEKKGVAEQLQREFGSISLVDSEIELEDEDEIGSGAFGRVLRGDWNGTKVAVKILKVPSLRDRKAFSREVNTLARLRHQNIVTLYGIVPLKRSDELGIVMELVSGGTLTDLQNKYDEFDDEGLIPLADVIEVAIQIASGLKYTHSRRLAHLDIKADNILLSDAPPKIGTVKLADFGLAMPTNTITMAYSTKPKLGTPIYSAPERWRPCKPHYSQDVYSFGILLWVLLTGSSSPYGSVDQDSLKDMVRDGVRPSLDEVTTRRPRAPQDILDVMVQCWDPTPEKRPTMVDVLRRLKHLKISSPNAPIPKKFLRVTDFPTDLVDDTRAFLRNAGYDSDDLLLPFLPLFVQWNAEPHVITAFLRNLFASEAPSLASTSSSGSLVSSTPSSPSQAPPTLQHSVSASFGERQLDRESLKDRAIYDELKYATSASALLNQRGKLKSVNLALSSQKKPQLDAPKEFNMILQALAERRKSIDESQAEEIDEEFWD